MIRKKRESFLKTLLEIGIVFAIFAVFGGWSIPDSNEPYYVGKAIHYWNPHWIPNDTFLESKDAHWTFYVAFGWLSFFCSPYGMAWIGRAVTWSLLAWSWQRLSFALIPIRWMAIPTSLALAYYVDAFHMAGEWILGGVEGKSFAFPFVFFGLEAMIRGRWHRTWIFLGIASAFHVLVGGWSVLVAGFVWLTVDAPRSKSELRAVLADRNYAALIPWGLFLGGAISLLGLVPALMLDHGTPRELVREAHQVYVFDRIYHHLVPYKFPWTFVARFFALCLVWALLCRSVLRGGQRHRRFDAFIWGTLLLTAFGFATAYGLRRNQPLAAEILRFYWFRLSDVAVPMGVAVGALLHLLPMLRTFRRAKKWDWPTMPGWLLLFGAPFAVYLLIDRFLFYHRLYDAKVAAEPAVPWALTILLCGIALILLRNRQAKPSFQSVLLWGPVFLYGTLLFVGPLDSLKKLGDERTYLSFSRVEPGRPFEAYYWIDACRWISDPANTPETAKFWVPREGTTFKWHARRSDVGTWKDVPQDALGLLAWRDMMRDLHYYKDEEGNYRDDRSLTILLWWLKTEEIESLRQKYLFDYIVCSVYPEQDRHKTLEKVFENARYRVYRVHSLVSKTETSPKR